MMSLSDLFGAVALLLSLLSGAIQSNVTHLTKAELYANGVLQPPYTPLIDVELNMQEAIQLHQIINKNVAGICHHDYETITEASNPNYFKVFAEQFPGDGKITARLEMDIFNIFNCNLMQLDTSILKAANFNIDELQAAGYAVRIWFTEMPECLGQKLPEIITDLFPEITGLIRPHVLPSIDPQQFEDVIASIVRQFTIERSLKGKMPVTLYEGWNEVESPGYFFGTRNLLVDNILLPMIKAVEKVEQEVGYPLLFASHSVANGSEGFTTNVNLDINNKIENRGYSVDWINWHWYGTYPFYLYLPASILEPLLGNMVRDNPWATPKEFYRQTQIMKSLFPEKLLMISEWSWGAHNDDYKAGAYFAGALIEMHHAGLKDANNFLLKNGDGFLNNLDQINPTGHVIKFFQQMGSIEIPMHGISPGDMSNDVSSIAAFNDDKITMLITRFFGHPNELNTRLNFKLDSIRSWLNADAFTIHVKQLNEEVLTGGIPLDTNYIVNLSDNQLHFSIDIPAQNTFFIEIDTIGMGDIINSDFTNNLSSIEIYPNPSKGPVTIQHNFNGSVEMIIYDSDGKINTVKKNIQKEETIKNLPNGIFMLQFNSGNKSITKKLVILD